MARQRGVSAPDLVGSLIDQAEDDELFASHATAYDELTRTNPDLLREIEHEDAAWEQSNLSAPVDEA